MDGVNRHLHEPDLPLIHLSWGTLRIVEVTRDQVGVTTGFRALTVPEGFPVRMWYVAPPAQPAREGAHVQPPKS